MKDAYIHLGISPTATLEEIEAAYETKKRLFNPSRFPEGSSEWEEAKRMTTIVEMAHHFAVASYFAPSRNESIKQTPYTPPVPLKKSRKWIWLALSAILILIIAAGTALHMVDIKTEERAEKARRDAANLKYALNPKTVSMDIPTLTRYVLRSTAYIEVDLPMGKKRIGSGFFVNESQDILTNYHVIEGAKAIRARGATSREFFMTEAQVRHFDKSKDIALITIPDYPFGDFPLEIAQDLPLRGESILAAGAPIGMEQTISNGIVSGFQKVGEEIAFVQITAPISPGSSGGPVINMNGEVVGVSTFTLTEGQNMNFAVACTLLNPFIKFAESQPAKEIPSIINLPAEKYKETYLNLNPTFVLTDDKKEDTYLDLASITKTRVNGIFLFKMIHFYTAKERSALPNEMGLTEYPLGYRINTCLLDTKNIEMGYLDVSIFYANDELASTTDLVQANGGEIYWMDLGAKNILSTFNKYSSFLPK